MIVNETVIVGTRLINRFRDKARATHKNSQRTVRTEMNRIQKRFLLLFLTHMIFA